MSRWNLAWLLGVPGLVILGVAVSISAPPPDKDYQLVRTVVDVLAEVDKHYVRELTDKDKQRLVSDMLNGGLEQLDKHSQYFDSEAYKSFESQNEGQFGGVGLMLGIDAKKNVLKVESPIPGTPAWTAGLKADDLILKIDDKSTEGMRVEDARGLIKGAPDTVVNLNVQTGDEKPRTVPLTRAVIAMHPVKGVSRDPADPTKWDYMVDPVDKIALVRLEGFNELTDKEMKLAVEAAKAAGAKGLVLDLRENPGGLLGQAVLVANMFIPDGTIVSTKDRNGSGKKWLADPKLVLWPTNYPLAVLVNGGSASASEIVASAIQDNKRGVVIGDRTYGKGSVQKVFPLAHGKDAVKLTCEVWMTPNNKNIHRWPDSKETDEWGVKPDAGFEVKVTDDERRQHAMHLRDIELVRPKAKDAKEAPKYEDKVLNRALEYLRDKVRGVGAAPIQKWDNAV